MKYIHTEALESESEVAQSCPTLCDPKDCSLPGSSLHGILQARVLEWVAISFFRESSQPRDRTQVSRIPGRCFNLWATRKALPTLKDGKPDSSCILKFLHKRGLSRQAFKTSPNHEDTELNQDSLLCEVFNTKKEKAKHIQFNIKLGKHLLKKRDSEKHIIDPLKSSAANKSFKFRSVMHFLYLFDQRETPCRISSAGLRQ